MKKVNYIVLFLVLVFTSCKNEEWAFPDYDYQAVYFGHQYPVRTITFGEDQFDTFMDNQGRFQIVATTGGVYEVEKDVTIDVQVDNSLAQNLRFRAGENEIIPMPSNYYQLASNRIIIPKGKLIGGVEVQLTDAFFADPLAYGRNYVIPLKAVSVANADSILQGKHFTLYAVKYVNEFHGFYLRRGKDVIEGKNGNTSLNKTLTRRNQYVERDEVKALNTKGRKVVELPLTFQNSTGTNVSTNLLLTFDNSDNCSISAAGGTFTATGSGKFVKKGEKNSWGQKDRDAVYLQYTIDHPDMRITATDTLVLRNRGVVMETFAPVAK
ncbi:DUF5627 domain-containing protein [Pedobacter sp. SYSU D00535]|uniref:DUF5627 domain-containing protein n=1 Tax=Pedobacter sp. SYSU D00535 TaxID=2810308 RepID=UPI001A95F773|nr:DUF5627 domain-containing protein [Pedobacter sp. SYSU D00535]